MKMLRIISLAILTAAGILICLIYRKKGIFRFSSSQNNILTQFTILEERIKQLVGIDEKLERLREKQDADSRELREKLYDEHSRKLQDAVSLLKETYGKMAETTSEAFRKITDRNTEVYKETARQLVNMAAKLDLAFEKLEQREHTQMQEEMTSLRQKICELERDPLRVQLEELAEARTAQAVHEQSVKKITTLFWPNNGEVKLNDSIGRYRPDVYIKNHRIRIVADEVTTENVSSIREKTSKVADYMQGLNANVGYVVIPNAGVDSETLREIKRTVPERGLYVVRLTEYTVHLQVWCDMATTGIVDTGGLLLTDIRSKS